MTLNDIARHSNITLLKNKIIDIALPLIQFDLRVKNQKQGNPSCQFVIIKAVREITEKI